MKKVYICSPFAGDVEKNVKNAMDYSRFAVNMGVCPITVHLLYPRFLDDSVPGEREIGLKCGLELLSVCDEIWVFGDVISSGMKGEIEFASKTGIPIHFFDSDAKRRGDNGA